MYIRAEGGGQESFSGLAIDRGPVAGLPSYYSLELIQDANWIHHQLVARIVTEMMPH